MKEKFKEIENFPNYLISNKGEVFSIRYGKCMMPTLGNHGYLAITLSDKGKKSTFLIHRLLATAFIPNPDNLPEINHKSGVKYENNIENLEWCTPKQNSAHATSLGLRTPVSLKGETNGSSKLTTDQVIEIKKMLKTSKKYTAIGRLYGITGETVSCIDKGKNWTHVVLPPDD